MVELGELERRKQEFADRKVAIYAVSNDDRETAELTQGSFPDLKIVSDANQALAKAADVLHRGAGPGGTDTNAPTTFLIDGTGTVQKIFRESRFLTRPDPDSELRAIDALPRPDSANARQKTSTTPELQNSGGLEGKALRGPSGN